MSFLESEFFMLRVPLLCVVCVSLSVRRCVSHSTLPPLYLSTPECNRCSGGVGSGDKRAEHKGQVSIEITQVDLGCSFMSQIFGTDNEVYVGNASASTIVTTILWCL